MIRGQSSDSFMSRPDPPRYNLEKEPLRTGEQVPKVSWITRSVFKQKGRCGRRLMSGWLRVSLNAAFLLAPIIVASYATALWQWFGSAYGTLQEYLEHAFTLNEG